MNTKLLVGLLVLALLVTACSQPTVGDAVADKPVVEQPVAEPSEEPSEQDATEEIEAGFIEEDSAVDLGELY